MSVYTHFNGSNLRNWKWDKLRGKFGATWNLSINCLKRWFRRRTSNKPVSYKSLLVIYIIWFEFLFWFGYWIIPLLPFRGEIASFFLHLHLPFLQSDSVLFFTWGLQARYYVISMRWRSIFSTSHFYVVPQVTSIDKSIAWRKASDQVTCYAYTTFFCLFTFCVS